MPATTESPVTSVARCFTPRQVKQAKPSSAPIAIHRSRFRRRQRYARSKISTWTRLSTFALKPERESRAAQPIRIKRSAEQLLDEASRVEETSTVDRYDDTPSVKEWLKNVFGVFTDLGVVAHWIGLSVLGSVPAVIALTVDSPILIMGLFPAGFFLGVLTVSCGFAILNAAANQEESVSDWPTLDPMAWLGQLFVVLAAACVAAIPVWAACQLILGTQLISVASHDVLDLRDVPVCVALDVGHEQSLRAVFGGSRSQRYQVRRGMGWILFLVGTGVHCPCS